MSKREQLNLRLPPRQFEVLGVAAMLDDVAISDYVKDWLGRVVAELETDPDIAAVLAVKARRNPREPDNVAQLADRRGTKGA